MTIQKFFLTLTVSYNQSKYNCQLFIDINSLNGLQSFEVARYFKYRNLN